jgi:peptidoglycan-associated lipoprotein
VGCSTSTTQDSSESITTIEDTSVATATVDTEPDPVPEMVEEDEVPVNDADTVFYFEFDKAVLNDETRAALMQHAEFLKANPAFIRLEGHADERGTREYNMALGERRAKTVKEYLVLQGVAASSMEVISYGEERAASFGSDESSWRMNRRVELKN